MGLFVDRHPTLANARESFSWDEAWDIVDGTPDDLNAYEECVERHQGLACRIKYDDGRTSAITFQEIGETAAKFANYLSDLGIVKGDTVGMVMEPSRDFLGAFFGTLKNGSVAIPCPAVFGPDAVSHRLVEHSVELLLAPTGISESLDHGLFETAVDPARLGAVLSDYKSSADTVSTTGSDQLWIQYTSGTTGRPTPVPFTHDSAVYWAPFMDFQTNVEDGDRFLTTASPGWGPGIWAGLFGPLLFGRPTGYAAGKFNPDTVLQALREFDITSLVGVAPTAVRKLLSGSSAGADIPQLKAITYTGEPMDAPLSRDVTEAFGAFPRGFYGITELRGNITADFCFPDYDQRHGSLGVPVFGTEVTILDDEDKECSPGEIGNIAARRKGDWFVSEDLGYVDEDGYYWSAGRDDDVIISAGYTIGPSVVEDAIRKHDAVDEVGVIGIPDDERGQVAKAFVELNCEPTNTMAQKIQNFVKNELSKHEYPREIEFVETVPMSGWGKINRKELREQEGLI
jgi:acetyl-CoA synthetase